MALAFDQNRQLLVGTGTPGRVFRVDGAGKGFLLLDTTYQEVRALRVDPKGVIYAAAQSSPRVQGGGESLSEALSAPPPVTPSIPNVSTEITSISVVDLGSASQSGSSALSADRRNPTGAVFRVQPDGLWDEMWASREDAAYDIAIEADGALLVATGTKGKLFRLSGDPVNVVLVTRVPAQQATMLVRVGRPHLRGDGESGIADGDLVGSRDARHLRIGREGRAARLDMGCHRLARDGAGGLEGRSLQPVGQHERRPTMRGVNGRGRTRTPRDRPSRVRKRAISSGARC